MYVLLKHEPFNPVKPYHIESLERYEMNPPKNLGFKMFGLYASIPDAVSAMATPHLRQPEQRIGLD